MSDLPPTLFTDSSWLGEGSNRTKLRLFLDTYAISLDDVYEIAFAKRFMVVYRYERSAEGHRFLADGEVARQEPKTVQYRGGITPQSMLS